MVLRSVIVTDLTRMRGSRVCVAGYAVTRLCPDYCIRPELRRGEIHESWLFSRNEVVRPFSLLQLSIAHAEPDPPHCEDRIVERDFTMLDPVLSDMDRWALLTAIDDGSVAGIYREQLVASRHPYVVAGTGDRSLGTIFPSEVTSVAYFLQPERSTWRYRLRFVDGRGAAYDLPVTDLTFRSYLDHLRLHDGLEPTRLAESVASTLAACASIALRIGLARPFANDHERRCYLQVNGIYSDPDYLEGRCFADFIQRTDPLADLPEAPF